LINDNISEDDKKSLANFILNSNRFTNGPKVREFEKEWSSWLGSKYSIMVNSGASANYITTSIVREIKGKEGEIIVPTIGWVSDVSSIINTGFVPVFVDISLSTMSIHESAIMEAINKNTKAIVLVHALGFNGINRRIIDLARKYNLILIEDCCEAHGATYENQRVGTFGDMSCFSFYYGHHITTIEGGMVCTNSEEIYQLARMFRSHGMTRESSPKTHAKYAKDDINPLFTFAVPGYNMRSTELNAVLGLEQIKRLDSNIKIRSESLKIWLNGLDPNLYYVDFETAGSSNFALPLIINPNCTRDKASFLQDVCIILEDEKVEYRLGTAGGGNQARQPYLNNYDYRAVGGLDVSNYIHDYGLYVGNHTDLSEEQIVNLCKRLNNV
jgi:CDP-6-deoxy-D-xylo-4-hexulose-3-dehydrase